MKLGWFGKPSSSRTHPKVGKEARVYVVGDIHGRHDLLLQLIESLNNDMSSQTDGRAGQLAFLGDYVDRGDASLDVLKTLSQLQTEHGDRVILLKGNHEDSMLGFLEDPEKNVDWLAMGGAQTVASFGVRTAARDITGNSLLSLHHEFSAAAKPFLAMLLAMPASYESGDVFFCHAGVNPNKGLSDQSEDALLWGHAESQSDWPISGKLIVHGHFDAGSVVQVPGRICLDTGAYYSGVLSAMRFDDEEMLFQAKLF